jgi:hypothetical protein
LGYISNSVYHSGLISKYADYLIDAN